MSRIKGKMASITLCLVSLSCWIHSTHSQNVIELSSLQKQTELVNHDFTKKAQTDSNIPIVYKNGLLNKINTSVLLNSLHPMGLLQHVVAKLASVDKPLPDNGSIVTNQCYRDLFYTIDSAIGGKRWALEILDAFGKPNAGILRGSWYFEGSYDECHMAKPRISTGEKAMSRYASKSREFGTRFCRVGFNVDELLKSLRVETRGFYHKLIWAMCVPDSCQSKDLENLLKLGFLREFDVQVSEVYCEEERKLSDDKSAIVAIAILTFFGLLIIMATLYDYCKSEAKPQPQNKKVNCIEEENSEELRHPSCSNIGYQSAELSEDNEYYRNDDTLHTVYGSIDPEIQRLQSGKTTQQPLIARCLLCFSAYTNISRLLNAQSNDDAVACIHGIRFLSLAWIVFGHTYNYGVIKPKDPYVASNLLENLSLIQRFTSQVVLSGGYAVDTFFVMSAFLMTWLFLKERRKRQGRCSVNGAVMFYFHRFWRLTPIYMMVVMIYACVYPHVISGLFAPDNPSEESNSCRHEWWMNLFYINNLLNRGCMGWSWYLAVDMQLYVISPIFLLIMYKSTGFGAISTFALMSLGIGIAFWKEHVADGNFIRMKLGGGGNWWDTVYNKPWCRVHCWAVGMLLGLIIYKRNRQPLHLKWLNALYWLSSMAVALFLVYIPYTENKKDGTEWTRTERAFYESFGRTAWGICVAWVIFACYTGRGGIVNSILSWNGFIPLSRLTYATYLVHPICMMTYSFNRRSPLYVNDYNIIYFYFGNLVASHMVAFVCSITFEAPFVQLEKVLRETGRKKVKIETGH